MKVKLKDVRIAFTESLFTPKEYQEGDGKPRFSATFLIDPTSDNNLAVEAAIKASADESYGVKSAAVLKGMRGNSNKFCYNDGNTKEYDGFEGMMFIAAHRRGKEGAPLVIGADKQPITEQSGVIYGGCYVNAVIDIYAQKGDNQGIRCALIGVQFSRPGAAFSGSRPSTDDFDDVSVDNSDLF